MLNANPPVSHSVISLPTLSLTASHIFFISLWFSLSFGFGAVRTHAHLLLPLSFLNSMDSSCSSTSSSSSSPKPNHHATSSTDTVPDADTPSSSSYSSSSSAVDRALQLVQSDDLDSKLQGAREIRRLTKTSQKCRRLLSDSVPALVSMLQLHDSPDANESALLALLNLAVKDETYAMLYSFANLSFSFFL